MKKFSLELLYKYGYDVMYEELGNGNKNIILKRNKINVGKITYNPDTTDVFRVIFKDSVNYKIIYIEIQIDQNPSDVYIIEIVELETGEIGDSI